MEAVRLHGEVLGIIEPPLNADKEIIEAAVKQSANACYFICEYGFMIEDFMEHLFETYPTHTIQYMLEMLPKDALRSTDGNSTMTEEVLCAFLYSQHTLLAALKQDIHVVNCFPYTWEVLKMTVIGREAFMKLFCDFYQIPLPIIQAKQKDGVIEEPCEKKQRKE